MNLRTQRKATLASTLFLLLFSAVIAGENWELSSQNGLFSDFEIADSSIYLAENLCRSSLCKTSRILRLNTQGQLLDTCLLNVHIWSIEAKGNFLLVEANKGFRIYTTNWQMIDSLPVGLRALLLSDSTLFYGKNCTDEEGLFSVAAVPKDVYIRDLVNKKTVNVTINAEAIAVRVVNATVYLVGRSGTMEKVVYKLYSANLSGSRCAKEIAVLPVSGLDVMAEEIWFVNDSLLMCRNSVCAYTEKTIIWNKVRDVNLDSLKNGSGEFLGYGGPNMLLFKKNAKIKSTWFLGENAEKYRQLITSFLGQTGSYRILNFACWDVPKNLRRCFAINDSGTKAAMFLLSE